jgi:hypothetical protein
MCTCKTKTTTNKSKTTKSDCDGIFGKSVQYGVQDKPWTDVGEAFVDKDLIVHVERKINSMLQVER